jgi:hypothetical protein
MTKVAKLLEKIGDLIEFLANSNGVVNFEDGGCSLLSCIILVVA